MFFIPADTINFLLVPIISAQTLLFVLLYFSIFIRHLLLGFYLHAIFLGTFSLYLIGTPLQFYTDLQTGIAILNTRVLIFYCLGLPTLLIALFQHCGIQFPRNRLLGLYLLASVLSVSLICIQDIANYNFIFSQSFTKTLPFTITNSWALVTITIYMLSLIILPCSYLVWHEYHGKRDPMSLAFLCGAVGVGLSHLLSHHIYDSYWIIYIGSVFTALCWVWAVYYDVKRTRGAAYVVRSELLRMIRTDNFKGDKDELNQLWRSLASVSEGDIQRYKLQVREVLSRLAEQGIDAGADSGNMLARANASSKAIEESNSEDEVLSIATQETLELGNLIADIPKQRQYKLVSQAQEYIRNHYHENIENNQIAEYCNSSASYLMRNFKLETNQTINQYLTDVRIDAAKNMLAHKTVTQTAYDVGFNNSNYFSTVFKKVTGQTPGQYQENLKLNRDDR